MRLDHQEVRSTSGFPSVCLKSISCSLGGKLVQEASWQPSPDKAVTLAGWRDVGRCGGGAGLAFVLGASNASQLIF